jgi:predicted phosphoribosyltransferase
MSALFKNRRDAGRFLATKLAHYAYQPDVLVLALPRGGVPVAYEIAVALDVAMDVFVHASLGLLMKSSP